MKKLIFAIVILFATAAVMPVNGQTTTKESKKALNQKSGKTARKNAKKLKKQGYFVSPGALPMDKQLEKAYIKQNMEDENGYPKYIVASGNAVAETQTAAKLQAIETAKLNLAGTINTNVAALIKSNIANEQLSREQANTVTKVVGASKSIIAQQLGRTILLSEMYKNVGKENIQCDVQIAYDNKTAMDIAKKVVRNKLEKETEMLQGQLDKLMDLK